MDFTRLLILQIIAHLLSDFAFQSNKNAKEKNKYGFGSKFIKWHILITFALSWFLSFQGYFVFGAIAIALTHWLTDGLKKYLIGNKILDKYLFFIDQGLHLIFIILIVYLFDKFFIIQPHFIIPIATNYLLIIAGYLICSKPGNIFIKEIINIFEISIKHHENVPGDLPNAGKLIGIIERWLVITFILLNQFEAVGFLIAAKSILRYKDSDTLKTEYVLIGTMLSFGIAIGIGILIKLLR